MLLLILCFSNKKKLYLVLFASNIVLTAAAMLGVTYPKDMGITHKIIKAFDLPTYKMTPHFE
jgi:hypothetical protein